MSSSGRPIELVRQPETIPASAGRGDWPITNWWLMAPLLAIGVAGLVFIQARRLRARGLSESERAFRALCRGEPTRIRVVARELADAHGTATPAAIVLSNGALAEAARRLDPEPGSTQHRVVNEWLARRGLAGPERV